MKSLLLGVVLFVAQGVLASDFYGVAGVGAAKHELNGNGVWYQEGFEHKIDSNSQVYQVGLGWKVLPWLAIEGLYHNFGKTHISADFVHNDDNYNPNTENHCNGPCNPLNHGEGTGKATGASLSLVPSYKFSQNWSLFGRLGVIWYKRTWEEKMKCCAPGTYNEDSLYGPELDKTFSTVQHIGGGEYLWTGDSPEVGPRSRGRAAIYGLGVSYKNLRAEYTSIRGISAPGSGHTDINTWTLSRVVNF